METATKYKWGAGAHTRTRVGERGGGQEGGRGPAGPCTPPVVRRSRCESASRTQRQEQLGRGKRNGQGCQVGTIRAR